MPLHSSLGDGVRLSQKERKKERVRKREVGERERERWGREREKERRKEKRKEKKAWNLLGGGQGLIYWRPFVLPFPFSRVP